MYLINFLGWLRMTCISILKEETVPTAHSHKRGYQNRDLDRRIVRSYDPDLCQRLETCIGLESVRIMHRICGIGQGRWDRLGLWTRSLRLARIFGGICRIGQYY